MGDVIWGAWGLMLEVFTGQASSMGASNQANPHNMSQTVAVIGAPRGMGILFSQRRQAPFVRMLL